MTSMVTYRLSPFHPLSDIPGPRLAKITKFWGAHLTWTGRQHLHLKALHDKYGPFVRTGGFIGLLLMLHTIVDVTSQVPMKSLYAIH